MVILFLPYVPGVISWKSPVIPPYLFKYLQNYRKLQLSPILMATSLSLNKANFIFNKKIFIATQKYHNFFLLLSDEFKTWRKTEQKPPSLNLIPSIVQFLFSECFPPSNLFLAFELCALGSSNSVSKYSPVPYISPLWISLDNWLESLSGSPQLLLQIPFPWSPSTQFMCSSKFSDSWSYASPECFPCRTV